MKNWRVPPSDPALTKQLADALNVSTLLAVLLQARGIQTPEQAVAMFGSSPAFSDPMRMADMGKAVARINRAIEDFERIAVYGDYDADGVTSTAMLYSYLESCGADVSYYIPDREGEGYGMNLGAIDTLHQREVTLIITVDNGISSLAETDYAASLGMDVVVTDHHRPREVLPAAVAVVDPHRKDCPSTYKDFSGVGVAFKLIMALEGPDLDLQALLDNYADLVAIGTIGDVVPLTGENRAFVKAGLRLISRTDRLGLRALMEKAGLDGHALTATSMTFGIVPRINATGRMGSPDRAVRLLVSEYPDEAAELAQEICDDNEYRRQIEAEIFEKALEQLQEFPERLHQRVLVVDGEDWHPGVIGIVSSRVTERFGKPSIIISRCGGEAKGSGRSVDGFSLFEAVCACDDLLTKFGGHPMAAGMSLQVENIPAFRERINSYTASLPGVMPAPELLIDSILEPNQLSLEIPKCVRMLEPFGQDNAPPLFGMTGMRLEEIRPVGNGKHLRLTFVKAGVAVTCMRFGVGLEQFGFRAGDVLDLAVTLDEKEYNGKKDLSIVVRDIKPSGMKCMELIRGRRLFDCALRGDRLTAAEGLALTPDREDFAVLYRYLRQEDGFKGAAELLLYRLGHLGMGLERLLTALKVLAEHGLCHFSLLGDECTVDLLPAAGKVNLMDSVFLRQVAEQAEEVPV